MGKNTKPANLDLVEGADMRGQLISAGRFNAVVDWYASTVVRHGVDGTGRSIRTGKVDDRFDVGNGVTAVMLSTSKA